MEDPTVESNTQIEARSAGEPGLSNLQQGYGGAPLQMVMNEPRRNILAHDDAVKPFVPAGQVYNHQNSCMHVASPMCNANNNPRSCHYNHCQHRCPRSMNAAPMHNGTMGFGNLNINTDIPNINVSNPLLRHNFDNPHIRPLEQCCHHGINHGYTPAPWHENMAIKNDVQHTPNQNEPLLAAAAPAQNPLDTPNQMKTIRFENTGDVETAAQLETARTEMSANLDQNSSRQNQEQSVPQNIEQHSCTNHSALPETTEHEHEAVEEENCPNVNEARFSQMDIRNKREISKGLTDDSAKSLIYFQGPDSEYSKVEREQANISRSRRFHQSGQVINSSQSLGNLNQQPDSIDRASKPAKIPDKTEELVPAQVPVKSSISNDNECVKKEKTNDPPVNQIQVAEAANDDKETGDNCERNVSQNSESGFSFGDCFKLNLAAKLTRKANNKDEMKRRNGLE